MGTDGIRRNAPAPRAPAPADPKKPAQTNVAAPAQKASLLDRLEGDARGVAAKLLGGVNKVASELLPKRFAEGRDGFIAFDPQTGAVTGGHAAGVTVREAEGQGTALGPLFKILGHGLEGDNVVFDLGGQKVDPAGTTAENGEQLLPADAERNLLRGLNPKTGGVVSVGIDAQHGAGTTANVLALPKDYDGPIFVSDIDDSIRPTKASALATGEVQKPIEGAKELLDGVSKLGAPIVYLSAGPSQIHSANEAFLQQFPKGVLLDNDHYGLANFNPSNHAQAQLQGDYKAKVLADLRAAYPNAKIFGLGDDKYGDAMAYEKAGATAYIHNVSPGQTNVPRDFNGVITDNYTPEFQAKVLGDIGAAVKRSASLGGDPNAKVDVPAAPANPPPNTVKTGLVGKLEHLFDTAKIMGHGVPHAIGSALLGKLSGTQGAYAAIAAMGGDELSELPPSARAHLCDELLTRHKLAGLLHKNANNDQASELALKLITANGTDAGAMDPVLSRMHVDASSALTGPAKAQFDQMKSQRAATPGDWQGFQGYLDQATGTRNRAGTQVEPLIDGATAFPAMFQAIDQAKSSVSMSVFAFQSDQAGWEMARRMAAAADRGCAVKLIYDPVGSSHSEAVPTDPKIYAFLREYGVQVIAQQPGMLGDHLTHRKITVIDGKVGFTGGMNVGDQYQATWHDVHARITGPGVADLQQLFVSQWQADGGTLSDAEKAALFPKLDPVAGAASARMIGHVGETDQNMKLAYLRAIDTAQKSVNIANPYFSDPDIVRHLCAAARRGVAVNVVLPQHNDQGFEQSAERALYEQLRGAGIHVWEYHGKEMAHDKVATFDGTIATIGSSNLDARSLQNNDEDNVWSSDPAIAADLDQRLFAKDLTESDEVLQYKPGVLGFVKDGVAHRFANLL